MSRVLVNRYPAHIADIEPRGFRVVEINGAVPHQAAEQVRTLLENPQLVRDITVHNYEVAKQAFSYTAAQRVLSEVLASFD